MGCFGPSKQALGEHQKQLATHALGPSSQAVSSWLSVKHCTSVVSMYRDYTSRAFTYPAHLRLIAVTRFNLLNKAPPWADLISRLCCLVLLRYHLRAGARRYEAHKCCVRRQVLCPPRVTGVQL